MLHYDDIYWRSYSSGTWYNTNNFKRAYGVIFQFFLGHECFCADLFFMIMCYVSVSTCLLGNWKCHSSYFKSSLAVCLGLSWCGGNFPLSSWRSSCIPNHGKIIHWTLEGLYGTYYGQDFPFAQLHLPTYMQNTSKFAWIYGKVRNRMCSE